MSVISDAEIILKSLERLYKAGVKYELEPAFSIIKEVDFQKAEGKAYNKAHKDIDDDYVPFLDKCGEQYVPN